jgi:hypothetical protein
MTAEAVLLSEPDELPVVGQAVTLGCNDGRVLTAVVRAVAAHRIAIDRPAGEIPCEVLVTWSTGRRVHTTEARLLPTAVGDRVDLAFGAIRGVDRRSGRRHRPSARFRVDLAVTAHGAGLPRAVSGVLLDLSATGLAVRSTTSLDPGTAVAVSVHGQAGDAILRGCPARVVRTVEAVGGAWLIAVELDLPPLARGVAVLLESVLSAP